ncbi:MAG: AI-2E family transporter [Methylovulum sp.]|uniref:AI-2E family transporter n=1 Tax=Methylovulum sp. TaxID=1916980 RepID=UPI00260267FC|nr:AI-2E family transporter [Methylovulum sp.]MDD2722634.1 AI-2E family transporter [Methylovulum sp.]MDD5123894.1 AI-2E family transporter [Methylovulum sp.]
MTDPLQIRARFIAAAILILLGAWFVQGFLPLLAWAVVLAISTWPIYQRLLISKELHGKVTWGAVALTLLIGAIILVPLSYGLVKLFAEAESLGQWLMEAQKTGILPPNWLEHLPMVGASAKEFWINSLGSKEAANSTFHWLSTSGALGYTKTFAGHLMQRFVSFLIILLVLLFVYQHGDTLSRQVLASSRRIFGDIGERYLRHAAAAVRGTVNGMMLIGIGKGLLIGVGYHLAGMGHPAILGALTGLFAMIPFAAKLIFGACSLVLAAEGHYTAALVLFTYGMVLTLIADNYVRPVLIGNAVKLPFIWTLLGIFGGMEAIGLLGLFLGPTLMAVLMSVWRDWIEDLEKSA